MRFCKLSLILGLLVASITAKSQTWTLWASGLPSGVYPRMVVSPNHDIFYTLLGTGVKLGTIYKANTLDKNPNFSALPIIPRPASIQNNIVALGFNNNNEPLAGIYRSNMSEPWLFRFNNQTQQWDTCKSDLVPTLGGHCIATAANGTIYVGARWAYIYKSTDNGKTFKAIDESKLLAQNYPWYFPTFLNKSVNDGAIFTVSIDRNNRVYAGTETAGVIYSDDEGASWHPADLFACKGNKNVYDTLSRMGPLAKSGNVAGIGFTKNNDVVWSGNDMWYFNWKNKLGFANLKDSTVSEVVGLPDYLVQTGQQVSKIVTTANGTMFLHSGSSTGATKVGIYKSDDGIHWDYFNIGITGKNDGQAQGSLAVDGNKVFMATSDGQVWMYDAAPASNGVTAVSKSKAKIYPNPASSGFTISNLDKPSVCRIINTLGVVILDKEVLPIDNFMAINEFPNGIYIVEIIEKGRPVQFEKLIIKH